MKEIFKGEFLALYNQIGLYDTEDNDSYPSWKTGLELSVFSKKGVAVSAKGDNFINVSILVGKGDFKNMIFYGKGQIYVGGKGLTLGNEIAASTNIINWDEGLTSVEIYGNGPQNESTTIIFILNHM